MSPPLQRFWGSWVCHSQWATQDHRDSSGRHSSETCWVTKRPLSVLCNVSCSLGAPAELLRVWMLTNQRVLLPRCPAKNQPGAPPDGAPVQVCHILGPSETRCANFPSPEVNQHDYGGRHRHQAQQCRKDNVVLCLEICLESHDVTWTAKPGTLRPGLHAHHPPLLARAIFMGFPQLPHENSQLPGLPAELIHSAILYSAKGSADCLLATLKYRFLRVKRAAGSTLTTYLSSQVSFRSHYVFLCFIACIYQASRAHVLNRMHMRTSAGHGFAVQRCRRLDYEPPANQCLSWVGVGAAGTDPTQRKWYFTMLQCSDFKTPLSLPTKIFRSSNLVRG